MKQIAIFVSGAGESAERIVRLFNEGNRVKTVLVVVDDSAEPLLERLKDQDVTVLHVPDGEWHSRSSEVAELLKEKEVKLIVLDGFEHSLSDEILEATDGEMIRVSSAQQAPREVVAALEADLRRPVEEVKEEVKDENPTPESEWADTLKIQFTPPKVPKKEPVEMQVPPVPDYGYRRQEERPLYKDYNNSGERPQPAEPMPSTWLIWSILVAVFCCFIPGIIAIIFSSQVSSKYYMGDLEGARRASRNAEIWIIVSFVLGVLAATLYIPFMLIG